ncbi:hypothetical protein BDN70DRAFT_934032 [Pholiota conissans]|uniref:Kelch repeat-containing protein n=1 Tax=Pholiota conissans TaxID=109636 RepID=A0A9P5YXN5_9AGAR|nr:hypothetical protein BDN70DRAFT_934032 [Pholiota conissans]
MSVHPVKRPRLSNARASQSHPVRSQESRDPEPERTRAQNCTGASRKNAVIKTALGDIPPYNDYPYHLEDKFNKKLYSIGGFRCDDHSNTPTTDFYVCDTSTMQWTNRTNCLTKRDPYAVQRNPLSRAERTRSTKPQALPAINVPGVALLRLETRSFVVMFGGFASNRARSQTLIIDPDRREWWELQIAGGDVVPRINPAMVGINNKIYIFSGYRQFGANTQAHQSYSIMEFDLDSGDCRWTTRDRPYPALVRAGQAFQDACSVFDGIKILLTPGEPTESKEPINITLENTFFYHVTNDSFQSATAGISGALPQKMRWYDTYCPPRPQKSTSNSSESTESILICAYIDVPGTGDVSPEVWRLSLCPVDKIECLGINKKIWDLDSQFKCSTCVDGLIRLLGTSKDDAEDANATFDIYVDIPWKK